MTINEFGLIKFMAKKLILPFFLPFRNSEESLCSKLQNSIESVPSEYLDTAITDLFSYKEAIY